MSSTAMEDRVSARTKWSYSVGCIGRDAVYTLVNTYLLYFMTRGLGLGAGELAGVGIVFVIGRIWDAVNDPVMGVIVDNTRSRWGKFKPWILSGALLNSIFIVLMFVDMQITGVWFVLMFALFYLCWDVTFTINDISYWSMYASFSVNPREREKVGSLARIFANVGMFLVIAGAPFIYSIPSLGIKKAFLLMALVLAAFFILCQLLIVFGVKERRNAIIDVKQQKFTLKDMFTAIVKNDQLIVLVIGILLFNTAFYITTGLGTFFFEFDYGLHTNKLIDPGVFGLFAIVLGVTQIIALALYPLVGKRFKRNQLFSFAVILVAVGYVLFMIVSYVWPTFVAYAFCGVLIFAAQAFIQLLILIMLADTIEYGQLKTGSRNEGVLFSINPFVTKMASAIQIGLNVLVLGLSGINGISNFIANNKAYTPNELGEYTSDMYKIISADVLAKIEAGELFLNITMLRLSMFILPLVLIVASYFIMRSKFKIDEKMHDEIVAELERRAEENAAEAVE